MTRVILAACCLALIDKRSSALFLGNFIGCNTLGCRISLLEQDVSQLKQQVMRLSAGNGMNFQQPNSMPYNQNQMSNQQGMNQLPNQFNQNGQQSNQQGNQQQGTNPTTRQTYANMPGEYPQELRRVQNAIPYQNQLNGQFMNAWSG